jgi:hypothetical protein
MSQASQINEVFAKIGRSEGSNSALSLILFTYDYFKVVLITVLNPKYAH